ncbi:hypothetical protein EUX98_g7554 [Antrodiella citrinella]|uniref:DUF6532 domain-containing protein n=1 Tax=Antrodiella citrinella TaxID=2447956 RepID=A0A4S4MTH6_9APHY|nr:hypothetical protein EUX98_g7554 [Antrodiella citrinella]
MLAIISFALLLKSLTWLVELVPGRKRAHSDTQPQPTKRTKSANVQGVGAVGNSAKRSKAARPAPAVKPPGVPRRALVPCHRDDEYSTDGDVAPDYEAGERYNAAVELMGLDPSLDPELEGPQDNASEDGNEDDEDEECSQLDEDEDDEEGEDDDADVGGSTEVPAWAADLRDDSPLPESFTSNRRQSARETDMAAAARKIANLLDDASDEAPIVRVKNLAEGLFDDNLDLVNTRKPRKTTAAQLLKKAKEEPIFYDSDADLGGHEAAADDEGNEDDEDRGSDNDSEDDNTNNAQPQLLWPTWTDLNLNHHGVANLVPQHKFVRRAINRGITLAEHDFAFVTAYPEIHGKVPAILVKRFEEDEDYRHAVVIHVSNRLSHARKDIKDLVASQIVPQLKLSPYGTLLPAADIQKIIQDLFVNRAYLYPPISDTNPRPAMSRPFQSSLILEVLRLAYFRDPASVGNFYVKDMKSSLPDKPFEMEIPRPMLLMAIAAVHAVMNWWTTGRPIPVPFHVDTGVANYLAAELFLDDVLCVVIACWSTSPADAGDAAEDAGVVDYANMPE